MWEHLEGIGRSEKVPEHSSSDGITERRKGEHVDIVINEDVRSERNYWDDVKLVHQSIPDFDFDDVSTKTEFAGRKIAAPILISGMTGGFDKAAEINSNLAWAAAELQIPMGVGSQRAALEDKSLEYTYRVVNDFDIPVRIANIGAPQLIDQKGKRAFILNDARNAMSMIDAHVLAIHLNYLQEVVQPEGDRNAAGVLEAMRDLCSSLPVMAKETGGGISRNTALKLKSIGVYAIDVGGLGGTSWSAVEAVRSHRKGNRLGERLGRTFWNWGIPTPASVVLANVGLPLVATGGIRSGLDVGRALWLGAHCAGVAGVVIRSAYEGRRAVLEELSTIIEELKVTMFLTGCRDLSRIVSGTCLVSGETDEWLKQFRDKPI